MSHQSVVASELTLMAKRAKATVAQLRSAQESQRVQVLNKLALLLRSNHAQLLAANQLDLDAAEASGLSPSMKDRLQLNPGRIEEMAQQVEELEHWPAVLGRIVSSKAHPQGFQVEQQLVPLGLLCMIFESRPNVIIDACALCIKTGNALLLKGGKEAQHSNQYLFQLVQLAMEGLLPAAAIQLVHTREELQQLLELEGIIDLVIPRGSERLIREVKKRAKMPVIAHDRGLCHLYLHQDADPSMAKNLVLNGKTQRPGVCNATETLLVHQDFPQEAFQDIAAALLQQSVTLKVDAKTRERLTVAQQQSPLVLLAQEEDYNQEWLSLILSIKTVSNMEAAVEHIQHYGSKHTEAIVTNNPITAQNFILTVDASCVLHNASTRLNDGATLGIGPEIGISTAKLHVYGPMGVEQLCIAQYVIKGKGHLR